MLKRLSPAHGLLLLLLLCPMRVHAQADAGDAQALAHAQRLLETVRAASYPELKDADIRLRSFHSESDYFRTQFDLPRFLSGQKMRFLIYVNPRVYQLRAPDEALRAVMAHELGHVLDFTQGKRVRLVGLVRLLSKGYTARFERRTDLQAIARGYGAGLKAYRLWLYAHIPARQLTEKQRDYFSPAEIDALLAIAERHAEALGYWQKHVPRNLKEITDYDAHPAA